MLEDFFTGGSDAIMDFGQSENASKICYLQTYRFSLHKTLIDGLEWITCGLL